jgi:hypothetical protein
MTITRGRHIRLVHPPAYPPGECIEGQALSIRTTLIIMFLNGDIENCQVHGTKMLTSLETRDASDSAICSSYDAGNPLPGSSHCEKPV